MIDFHEFDVFLCHNSKDKTEVIKLAQKLKEEGLKPWLDVWELQPGLDWQDVLEQQIKSIPAAAVFIDQNGIGPWQSQEIKTLLRQFVNRQCPVIPVLLSNAPNKPELPPFLESMMWVDFRPNMSPHADPMEQLVWGITGKKPWQMADLRLESQRGIDYTPLQNLLAAEAWQEANEETTRLLLKASGRETLGPLDCPGKAGTLGDRDIATLPCRDLCTIDSLWMKYSNGHFGFSTQLRIWKGVKDWRKFVESVHWFSKESLQYSLASPIGHLPTPPSHYAVGNLSHNVATIIGRLAECKVRYDLYGN